MRYPDIYECCKNIIDENREYADKFFKFYSKVDDLSYDIISKDIYKSAKE